ncbi:hypothetical protein B7486_72850, partial [cyanobacterium TDX16]
MTAPPVLALRGIWKRYAAPHHLAQRYGARDIAADLLGLGADMAPQDLRPGEHWALADLDLQVEPGQAVGILGRNGAGKSTALRVAAGITRPDRGSVHAQGRMATLLDPAAGLNPVLSGRENVKAAFTLWNGDPSVEPDRLERIAELADLGDLLDAPLRTYSKG